MQDLHDVLCAIDLGPSSDLALQEADRVARRYGARLTVLHALPDGFPGVAMSPGGSAESILAQQEMSREVGGFIASKVASTIERSGGEVVIEVDSGTAHELILSRAEELGAGLVVLGALGGDNASPDSKILLGSVAAHVVKKATTAVLIARRRRVGGPVIATTDFSDVSALVMRLGFSEATARSAPLVVVHSVDPELSAVTVGDTGMAPSIVLADEARAAGLPLARARLAELVRQLPAPVETLVLEESPAVAIPAAAAKMGADLVVIGAPHHSVLERLVRGGDIVADLVRDCACSVLVARERTPSPEA